MVFTTLSTIVVQLSLASITNDSVPATGRHFPGYSHPPPIQPAPFPSPPAALLLPAQLGYLLRFRHPLSGLDEQAAKDEALVDATRLVARLGHVFGWAGRLLEQSNVA